MHRETLSELYKLCSSGKIVCIIADKDIADELMANGVDALSVEDVMPGFHFGKV